MNSWGLAAENHYKWTIERLTDTFDCYVEFGFNKTVEYLTRTRFISTDCAKDWIMDSLKRFKK